MAGEPVKMFKIHGIFSFEVRVHGHIKHIKLTLFYTQTSSMNDVNNKYGCKSNLDPRAFSLTESLAKYWRARSGKYIALGSRLGARAILISKRSYMRAPPAAPAVEVPL